MSLNWNATEVSEEIIESIKAESEHINMWGEVVQSFAFGMMRLGIGNIDSPVKAQAYMTRYIQWELSMGREYIAEKHLTTLDRCYQMIGFRCNVSDTTDAAFAKQIRANMDATAWRMVQEQMPSEKVESIDKYLP